ncbi:PE-PGRS family protein PE_PGRS33 [Mycobacterium persicum]|uniref:PE-PGRS family protein PE_PGRS33 n=1 Tax=Mycobacterium persicum TaxID=1487726 RepID=A0ABY6RNC9_9MYCO|nr:PE-PGRS family protein PE_PGRS33 [Mycobacterium persicum]VAZ98676.1 PE-PGRS family protein PE_PGRS33 [Mycobacterium persicum]
MAYVLTQPESMAAVAADVAELGSTISGANAAAASRTTGLLGRQQMRCRRPPRHCSTDMRRLIGR